MSNESQYFNPIVQAMMETARNLQSQQALKQSKEQFQQNQDIEKRRTAIAEAAQATHQQQVENEHEYQSSMAQHAHDILQAQMGMNKVAQVKAFQDALMQNGGHPEIANLFPDLKYNQGAMSLPPGTSLPEGTQVGPPDSVSMNGGGSVPISALPNPAEQIQQLVARTGAVAGAQAGTLEPFKVAEEERKRQTETQKQNTDWTNRLSEIGLTGQNAERVAQIHANAQTADARINGANHLQGIAMMHQFGLDDGSGTVSTYAKQLTDDIFNGKANYTQLTQDQKRLVDNYAAATGERGIPTDGKSYSEKLGTMSGLQSLVDQYRDLAQNYSTDSAKGGFFARAQHGQLGGLVGTSDLNSKLDTIKASGGALATYFDKQNRKSDAEILRQTKAWFDPTATAAENLQKINTQTGILQKGVQNVFSGIAPDRANLVMKNLGLTDFGGIQQPSTSPSQNGIVTDSKGIKWKYKGTGDPKVQSNYDQVPQGQD